MASFPTPDLASVSPDAMFVVDVDGRLAYANAAAEEMLGWERDRLLGRSVLDIVHADDVALVVSSMDVVQGKPVGTPIEVRVADPAGRWRWLEVIGRDCTDVEGINGILCTARDLTTRRMWEVAAGDIARFQQVVQHAAAIVLLLDADGTVQSVNGAFGRLLGHDPSVVVGTRLARFAAPGHQRAVADAIATAAGARIATIEAPMWTARGATQKPIRFEIVNLLDDPVVGGFVVTGHDVSELQEAKRRLEHLATHDALTGLPNRSMLHDRIEDLVAAGRPLALLYADLDRFKPVNDELGHESGDELLRCVARRLVRAVDASDLVARVGGDEFVVVALGITSRAAAVSLAHRLEQTLAEPFTIHGVAVSVGSSIGVAVAHPDSTAASLLAEADVAMYAVKAS